MNKDTTAKEMCMDVAAALRAAEQKGRAVARDEVRTWLKARMAEATQRPEVYEGERWGLATVSDELRRFWKEHP